MVTTKPQDVLDYWFGDVDTNLLTLNDKNKFWFSKNEKVDAELKARFGKDLERAGGDELRDWEKTIDGRMALIILFDQFSRNIYRNTPQAFAYDSQALALAIGGVKTDQDKNLSFFQRAFFYLPFEHSEDLVMQQHSVALYAELLEEVPDELQQQFQMFYDYAVAHKDIIDRFGRYPHRNDILGRESTQEELEFLKQPNSSF